MTTIDNEMFGYQFNFAIDELYKALRDSPDELRRLKSNEA